MSVFLTGICAIWRKDVLPKPEITELDSYNWNSFNVVDVLISYSQKFQFVFLPKIMGPCYIGMF
jgi:hypothetical protein